MRKDLAARPQVLARVPLFHLCLLQAGCGPVQAEEPLRYAAAVLLVSLGLFCLAGGARAIVVWAFRSFRVTAQPPPRPLNPKQPPRRPIAEQERTRTPESHPPQTEELLLLVSRRLYGMSLREVCGDLWPLLRWKPLLSGDDSASERIREGGKTAAQLVHAQMMALAQRGSLTLRLSEHEEIEAQAAIVYEVRRHAQEGGRHAQSR